MALGARMSQAVVEMSAKGFGCVGITDRAGRLIGIITDGDLRRHMRADAGAADHGERASARNEKPSRRAAVMPNPP